MFNPFTDLNTRNTKFSPRVEPQSRPAPTALLPQWPVPLLLMQPSASPHAELVLLAQRFLDSAAPSVDSVTAWAENLAAEAAQVND